MRIGHTEEVIQEIGLYLENRTQDRVLLAARDMQAAVYILERVIPRVKWKRKLREGMVIQRSRYRVLFGSGAQLKVISVQGHQMRGLRVDAVFAEDRVLLLPNAYDIRMSLGVCEFPSMALNKSWIQHLTGA